MIKKLFTKQFIFCIFLLTGYNLFAQQKLTGTVSSMDGPLPGATIVVKGSNSGTTTDFDGNFSIEAKENDVLIVSYVGFATQEMAVGSSTQIFFILEQDQLLDEVVVTALGITREKKSLGYAVTEVAGDNVNTIKDNNLANSLVGKVAGLQISQSGGIGSASRITIRGNNSLSGNTQALIVVDGVPINADGINSGSNDDGGGVFNSKVVGGGISDINPNDVESISVLKGPNASALYGSRAGNGVILVTTKKGTKNDRLGVTINSNITFDTPLFLPDLQNQYGQGTQGGAFTDLDNDWGIVSWGSRLDGSQKLYYTGENRAYSAQPNNVEDFFQQATKTITSVSLDKGFDSGSLRFSYTNNSTESVLENSDLNSHNFNLRAIANLSDKFSVDSKATYFTQEVTNRIRLGGEGLLGYVYKMPRNVAVNDLRAYQVDNPASPEDFSVISYGRGNTGNPFWMLYNDENRERRNRFLGFSKFNYEFTDWLSGFVRVGADVTNVKESNIEKPGHHFYAGGRMEVSEVTYTELNSEFLLTANKDLNEKLNVIVNVGGNMSRRSSEGLLLRGENFKIPTKFFISNLSVLGDPVESPQAIKKVNSLYSSVSAAYDNFLYLDLSARNDWSSTLSEENRSYLYNSVSLSAILNRFIDPSQNFFNLIKVRGSIAEVGNDTDPYQLYQTFSVPGQGYLGLTTLTAPTVKLNPNLKPETVTSTEFGLELSMLNNKLSVDLSVYDMTTTDLIFNVPVPAATGYTYFKENIGEVTNKGIEIALSATPVDTVDFSWNTAVFYSKNENEIVVLTEGLDSFVYNTSNNGDLSIKATAGGSIGDLYGTAWATDEQGNKLVDADGVPIATTSNEKHLGNAQPDWIGGWSNTVSYKDFSLSFLIDARIGGQIYSQTSAELDAAGVSERSLQFRDTGVTLDAINTGTDSANTNGITAQQYWTAMSGIAENYVYDQDNIRLRELAIGYRIPNTASIGVQSATLQLIGRNLFFFSKSAEDIDPESMVGTTLGTQGLSSNAMPTLRSIGLNLTLNF